MVNVECNLQTLLFCGRLIHFWSSFGISKHADNPRPFFKACIEEGNTSFCIFASEHSFQIIDDNIIQGNRKYLIGGTFKIVPHGCFKQLLIVYIEYFEKVNSKFYKLHILF